MGKKLLQLGHSIFGRSHRVALHRWVHKELVVVAAGRRLVAEEVDLLARHVFELRDVLQAVALVPAFREHVKANLPTDGVLETEVRKCCAQRGDERLADFVLPAADSSESKPTSKKGKIRTRK